MIVGRVINRMLPLLAFKDTLHRLFLDQNCLMEGDLSILADQKILVDDSLFFRQAVLYPTDGPLPACFQSHTEAVVQSLRSRRIDITVVQEGTLYSSDPAAVESARHLQSAKFEAQCLHYARQLYENDRTKPYNKPEKDPLMVFLEHNAYFSAYISGTEEGPRGTVLGRLGVDHIRAPRLKDNQLVWMYEQQFGAALASSPLLFIYPNVNQIISHFDFPRNKFYFYDFDNFCQLHKTSGDKMRAVLMASLAHFYAKALQNPPVGALKVLAGKDLRLDERSNREAAADLVELLRVLDQAVARVADAPEKADLALWAAEGLKLDKKKDLDPPKYYLFSSQVLSDTGDLLIYPGKSALNKAKFCYDSAHKEAILYYCMGFLPDFAPSLVSQVAGHSYAVPLRAVAGESLRRIKSKYLAEHVGACLGKILELFPTQAEGQKEGKAEPKYSLYVDQDLEVSVTPTHGQRPSTTLFAAWDQAPRSESRGGDAPPTSTPDPERPILLSLPPSHNEKISKLSDVVREFQIRTQKDGKLTPLTEKTSLSQTDLFIAATLGVLDQFGYLSLKPAKLSVLAEQLFRLVDHRHLPEAILLFELVKTEEWETPIFSAGKARDDSFAAEVSLPETVQRQIFDRRYLVNGKLVTPDARRDPLSYQKYLLVEQRFQLRDRVALDFVNFVQKKDFGYDPMIVVSNSFTSDNLRQVEILTIFSLLMSPDTPGSADFDPATDLLADKLRTVQILLTQALTTHLTHTVLKTSTKRDFGLLKAVADRFGFAKRYSAETAIFTKTVALRFLIFRTLQAKYLGGHKELGSDITAEGRRKLGTTDVSFFSHLQRTHDFFISVLKACDIVFPKSNATRNHKFWKAMEDAAELFEGLENHIRT